MYEIDACYKIQIIAITFEQCMKTGAILQCTLKWKTEKMPQYCNWSPRSTQPSSKN